MKLFTKTTQNAVDGQRNLDGTATDYEVPTGTITWVSIIYLLIQTTATTVSNYITNKPQQQIESQNAMLKQQNFQVQLLQRALEADTPADRKTALLLFMKTGLLTAKNEKEFAGFVEQTPQMPKWQQRPLETMDGYSKPGTSQQVVVQTNPLVQKPLLTQPGQDSGSRPRTPNIGQ